MVAEKRGWGLYRGEVEDEGGIAEEWLFVNDANGSSRQEGKMIIKRKLQVAVNFTCGRRCGREGNLYHSNLCSLSTNEKGGNKNFNQEMADCFQGGQGACG